MSESDGGSDAEMEQSSSEDVSILLRLAPEGAKPPLLVSFASGTVPSKAGDTGLVFTLQKNPAENKKKRKMVMGADRRKMYKGSNFGSGGSEALDQCQHVVGIRRPGSNEVILYPVEHCYSLHEELREVVHATGAGDLGTLSYQDQKRVMINDFGTRKSQNAAKADEANKIKADAVLGGRELGQVLASKLAKTGAEGEGVDAGAAALEESRRSFLPPYHASATTAEGVYVAQEVVTRECWSALERQVDADAGAVEGGLHKWLIDALDSSPESSAVGGASQFVWSRIQKLAESDTSISKEKLIPLLHLGHMVAFFNVASDGNLQRSTYSSLASELSMPEFVVRHLINTFTSPDDDNRQQTRKNAHAVKVKMTQPDKNKLQTHILCLSLIVEDFRLGFSQLATEMKCSPHNAGQLMRNFGCKTTNGLVATLPLPLTFPAIKKKGRSSS